MGYSRHYTLLGASSSTLSSAPVYIGDARFLAVSVVSSTGSASNVTLRGSLAQGFQSAIPDQTWSVLTVLPNAGVYTIEPGVRWLLAERAAIGVSAASNVTVTLAMQVRPE